MLSLKTLTRLCLMMENQGIETKHIDLMQQKIMSGAWSMQQNHCCPEMT